MNERIQLPAGIDPASLTSAQRDGLACVVCGRDYLKNPVPRVPVGRSGTSSQVFACDGGEGVRCAALLTGRHAADAEDTGQPTPDVRPSWLVEPCPAWCLGGHEEGDHPADRRHWSEELRVPLSLAAPVEIDEGCYRPEQARAYLEQHVREREPFVCLSKGDEPAFELTLDEARALAEALLALVEQGAGGGR
ncbi:hypothetical protein C3Y87_11140 [Carbonactinospora thermoautotrophica]|uniref:DUF6907 domain-containing protein n=1 Tax=Carbonactinospora thermoautotrophica TaxID=1469144 RepID=UPI00226DED62|nr:hypothetical protein [Carbonactinospora thermoautotrophica]MCX9191961.1 hypothetical protein [Carbonactinospora thermoautotrophica]